MVVIAFSKPLCESEVSYITLLDKTSLFSPSDDLRKPSASAVNLHWPNRARPTRRKEKDLMLLRPIRVYQYRSLYWYYTSVSPLA